MNRIKRLSDLPKVTTAVIIICIAVFAFVHLNSLDGNSAEKAILCGAYYKPFIIAGEWWRLLTVGFVHTEIWHLAMNLFAMWNLGSLMEKVYGSVKFAAVLFLSVIFGSVFLFVMTGNSVSVGLSGGLYGLMTAEIYWIVRNGGLKNPQIKDSLIRTVIINAAINFVGGIAWQAHLGGAVCGILMAVILDHDPSAKTLRRNTIAAAVILVIALGVMVQRSEVIAEDEQYLRTDMNILEYEKNHGLNSHAKKMAANLDDLYGTTILSAYIGE